MENEVLNCIKTRRSVRKYKPDQIAAPELDVLLEAAVWAPSGHNAQSWQFTVLQDRNLLLRLNEMVRAGFAAWEADPAHPNKSNAKAHAERPGYNFYYQAPTLIVASSPASNQNGMADCAAALQNVMLAAHSIGLGTCWINQLRWLDGDAEIRALLAALGLPREHRICGAVAAGYSDIATRAPARKDGTVLIVNKV